MKRRKEESKPDPEPIKSSNDSDYGGDFFDRESEPMDVDKRIIIGMQIGPVVFVLFSLTQDLQDGWNYVTITDRFVNFAIIAVGFIHWFKCNVKCIFSG